MKQKILSYTFLFFSIFIFFNFLGKDNFVEIIKTNTGYNTVDNSYSDSESKDYNLSTITVFQTPEMDLGSVEIIFVFAGTTPVGYPEMATLSYNDEIVQTTTEFTTKRSGEFIVEDLTPQQTYEAGEYSVALYSSTDTADKIDEKDVPEFTVQQLAFFEDVDLTSTDNSITVEYKINLGYIDDKNSYTINPGESVKLYDNSGEEPMLLGEDFDWVLDSESNMITGTIEASGLNSAVKYNNLTLETNVVNGDYSFPISSQELSVSTLSSFPLGLLIGLVSAGVLIIILFIVFIIVMKKSKNKKSVEMSNSLDY